MKIINVLNQKGLSDYCMKAGLSEIDEEEYLDQLNQLIDKKLTQLHGEPFTRKNKAARFAIGKGYEAELVWNILNNTSI